MFEHFMPALATVFQLSSLLWISFGVVIGITVGALPGLTATMGIAIMLPMCLMMEPSLGMATLLGVYLGAVTGASIPAILLGIPGNPNAIATVADGQAMAKKGQAGKALGLAVTASFIGGVFSLLVLMTISPFLAKFALSFGPPEYFALALMGLTLIASVSGKSLIKGLIPGVIGLMISTIGFDPITGSGRYIFGNPNLMMGISLIPVLIGLYAIGQMYVSVSQKSSDGEITNVSTKNLFPSLKELWKYRRTIFESALLGTGIGVLPGTGASIAVFLAYERAKKISKNPEEFGKGAPDGILAPETANNAVTGGALVPTLTLGIPGDGASALLLGALVIFGLNPGPLLFRDQAPFIYTIFLAILVANVFMVAYQVIGIRLFIQILRVPSEILMPLVLLLGVVGAYSLSENMFDVAVALVFGVVAFLFARVKIPLIPMILGVILGGMFESELRRGLILYQGNFLNFFTRPIFTVLFMISVASLIWPWISKRIKLRKG